MNYAIVFALLAFAGGLAAGLMLSKQPPTPAEEERLRRQIMAKLNQIIRDLKSIV